MGLETTEGTEPSRVEWSGEVLRKEEEFLATWSWQSDRCVCVCVVCVCVCMCVCVCSVCVCVLFTLQSLLLLLFEWPHSWHIQHPESCIQHTHSASNRRSKKNTQAHLNLPADNRHARNRMRKNRKPQNAFGKCQSL